jgi:hypothetical protein
MAGRRVITSVGRDLHNASWLEKDLPVGEASLGASSHRVRPCNTALPSTGTSTWQVVRRQTAAPELPARRTSHPSHSPHGQHSLAFAEVAQQPTHVS